MRSSLVLASVRLLHSALQRLDIVLIHFCSLSLKHLLLNPVFSLQAAKLAFEYGGLACTVEVVGSMEEAVDHIHKY